MTTQVTIRPAVASDLDRLLQLGEARRSQYGEYHPVFWRRQLTLPTNNGPTWPT